MHIGSKIKLEVERKRLTYKEFGALINRNEKTIPDIYDRETMAIDLLIAISGALKKDFLSEFYSEEPLKSLRDDEVAQLNQQIQTYKAQVHQLSEENKLLHKELDLTRELNEAMKMIISFSKEQIEQFKSKLAGGTPTQ